MSCQIRTTAYISDISAIRRCLFPTDDLRGTDNWLQHCQISVAPTGDIVGIANERRLVVLISKWDSATSSSQYQILFSGSVHESENIRAILCLPIVGETQSSHVGPDWTCILLGFDSGFLRLYTEKCELLYEEQLHNENISNIKCQSQHSPRPDISPHLHSEEIYVQYQNNVCIIAGNQIFPALRNYRSQLARLKAKGELLDISQSSLNLKKWSFQDQSVINDVAVVGLNISNTFDHLLTASACGGFETKYRTVPPHNSLVLAIGAKPFVGFHYATEGGAQPVLSDVAKAVANKLKSTLPSWLTGQRTHAEKQITVAMQPSEPMGCRFGLCDLRRTGSNIILSHDRTLGVTTDGLGRVILIDTSKGVALHVFKGYREAQCSFIQVPEEKKSKHRSGNRVALFLVIYSPKRGTIDIFTALNGTKITTFTASKFSRLVYINYGLMGFSSTSKSRYVCQFTTVLVDNDGQLKEISIPFHFALTEKNNKRSRDIHLYKKLRELVKGGEYETDELIKEAYDTCTELKTIEMKTQLIDMLMTTRDVPFEAILKCARYYAETLESEPDAENCDNFKAKVINVTSLLSFFEFVTSSSRAQVVDVENGDQNVDSDESKLNLDLKELTNLQKLIDLSTINDNKKSTESRVKFLDNNQFSISDFLSAFDVSLNSRLPLKQNCDEKLLFKVSEILFKRYIDEPLLDYKQFQREIKNSNIVIKDLFYLLVNYWVNKPLKENLDLKNDMNNLSNVLYAMIKTNREYMSVDYNEVSKFWSEIRDILANSNRPFPALTAAILCKYVAHKIEHELEMDESPTSLEEENIEMLSQENCEWSLLIGKLEDVSLLNILLASKPQAKDCPLPKLKHDNVDISLKYVLQRKGSVSELVARWLTLSGLNPENIVTNDLINKKSSTSNKNELVPIEPDEFVHDAVSQDKIELIQSEPVFEHLNLIKVQFPYSLECGMILANMSWEYALHWKNDIQNLGYLEASIECLKHIPNYHVKQGLFNLVWNTHLKLLFESASKLLNKVGKLPLEPFCRQATGLSDVQLTLFIVTTTNFLDTFTDIVQHIYNVPKTILNFEPMWEDGGQPLVELAIQQNCINYDLLQVHYQVSLVLQMLCTFSIKHSKILNSLFDADVGGALFTDFQSKPQVDFNKSDGRIASSRTQFLCKVITASIETITVTGGSVYSGDHVTWMSKCLLLCRIWSLDVDVLRRYQVVQLFNSGYNILAGETLPAVNESNKLGLDLLAVAGKRMSKLVASSTDLGEKLSALSPTLTKYLDTLNGDWCAPSSIEDILNLTTLCLSCLDDSQPEHKLALLLLEACSTLKDLQT